MYNFFENFAELIISFFFNKYLAKILHAII